MSDSTSRIEAPADDSAGRFWRLWSQEARPDVDAFLAQLGETSPAVTAAILRIDQRESWRRGERVPAETYLARHPIVLTDDEITLDLVFNEYLVREQLGDLPDVEEFLQRFPMHADILRAQIELHRAVAALPLPELSTMNRLDGVEGHSPDSELAPEVPGYEILGEVGRGGMGVIYKARQLGLNRLVALKMISSGAYASAAERARFRTEAEAVARLRHPSIVQIYEVGSVHSMPYLALEYMEGGSLAQALGGKPWAPHAAAELIELLARTIHAAHEQGIIHRDLKPSNILFSSHHTSLPIPKISDFGLAKDLTDGSGQTTSGAIMGTPSYMAPEQAEGSAKHVGPRADVYGLGAILYETITGRPPFQGETLLETLFQVRMQEPVSPSRLQPGLPRDLVTICLKALAKEPERRYASAAALADDLRRYRNDLPIAARSVTRFERSWRWCRRNPVLAGASAAAAVFLVVASCFAGVATLVSHERNVAVVAQAQAEEATQREKEAKQQLAIRSHLARAAAFRRSGQPGQRFSCLEELKKALALEPTPEDRHEICDEAAAALVLPDVEIADEWEGRPEGTVAVAFDDSLQRYARLAVDGTVTLHRLRKGAAEEVARFSVNSKPPFSGVWISPDGAVVVVNHGPGRPNAAGAVTAWRLDWQEPDLDPREVYSQDLAQSGTLVAFRNDSRLMAFMNRHARSVTLVDLVTGHERWETPNRVDPNALAFQPDGDAIAWSQAGEVVLHDVADGRERNRLRQADGKLPGILNLAWQPGGRRLAAASDDDRIHIWDIASGREAMSPLVEYLHGYMTIAFNRIGDRLISNDLTRTTHVWDAANGRLLMVWPCSLNNPQFSADDSLVGTHWLGTRLRLWRFNAGHELRVLQRRAEPDQQFTSTPVPHEDGRVLAARSADGLGFFDLQSGEQLAWVQMHRAGAFGLSKFIEPGGWITFSAPPGTLFWPARHDARDANLMRVGPPRLLSGAGQLGSSASSDGKVVAMANGNGALLQNLDGPVPRRFDLGPQSDVRATAVSPDKRWVATCSWNPDAVSSVQIWDAHTGVHVHNLPLKHLGNWAWFSPDNRWLVTTVFGIDTHLWEVGTWREVRTYGEAYVTFSPTGLVMALGDKAGTVRLVEPASNREIARLTGHEPIGYDPACFTADGTRLIADARDRHAVYVWDLRAIRRQLQELGLDWDLPPFPPQPAPGAALKVEVDRGYLTNAAEFLDARAAVAFLSLGLMVQPVSPEAYYHRGIALDRLRMRDKAIPDYSMFLALTAPGDRRRAEVLYRRAEGYSELKDEPRAIRDLLEMAELDLNDFPWPELAAFLCNNIAWNQIVKPGGHGPQGDAVRLAQLAIRLDSNLFIRNTMGVLHYRLGRWREAIDHLEPNVELNPMAAWDLYFLAMSYQRLGDTTTAKARFDSAVRLQAEKLPPSLTDRERAELKAIRAEAEEVLAGK